MQIHVKIHTYLNISGEYMKENLFEKLQNELIGFMHMCSKEDLNLLICQPKEKTIDDFARFFCLGVVFDLRGVFLKIVCQYETLGNVQKLLDYIDALKFETIDKWVNEFLEKIPLEEIKDCAYELWEVKKNNIMKNGFEFSKLL